MAHVPRAYHSLQHELASLPLDVICVARTEVQLILTLDGREESANPFVVRAWDWIPPGPMGRRGTVRGTLQIWAVNAASEVIYRAVYSPERVAVE